MKDLALQICEGLGIQAAQIQAEQSENDSTLTLTLRLPYEGVQRLDGREHRTAKAVRLLLSTAAAAQGKRFELVAQAND